MNGRWAATIVALLNGTEPRSRGARRGTSSGTEGKANLGPRRAPRQGLRADRPRGDLTSRVQRARHPMGNPRGALRGCQEYGRAVPGRSRDGRILSDLATKYTMEQIAHNRLQMRWVNAGAAARKRIAEKEEPASVGKPPGPGKETWTSDQSSPARENQARVYLLADFSAENACRRTSGSTPDDAAVCIGQIRWQQLMRFPCDPQGRQPRRGAEGDVTSAPSSGARTVTPT